MFFREDAVLSLRRVWLCMRACVNMCEKECVKCDGLNVTFRIWLQLVMFGGLQYHTNRYINFACNPLSLMMPQPCPFPVTPPLSTPAEGEATYLVTLGTEQRAITD